MNMLPKDEPLQNQAEKASQESLENGLGTEGYEMIEIDDSYMINAKAIATFFAVEPEELMKIKKYTKLLRDAEQNIPSSQLSLSARIGKVYNDLWQHYDPAELKEIVCRIDDFTSFSQFLTHVSATLGPGKYFPYRITSRDTKESTRLNSLTYMFMHLSLILAMGLMTVIALKLGWAIII